MSLDELGLEVADMVRPPGTTAPEDEWSDVLGMLNEALSAMSRPENAHLSIVDALDTASRLRCGLPPARRPRGIPTDSLPLLETGGERPGAGVPGVVRFYRRLAGPAERPLGADAHTAGAGVARHLAAARGGYNR